MAIVKEVQDLFESKTRIKVALVLWIALLLLFLIPTTAYPGMPQFAEKYSMYYVPAFAFMTAWLLVEVIMYMLSSSTKRAVLKANKKKFENLSAQSINILKFWSVPGNRYKKQVLDIRNSDVYALQKANIIDPIIPIITYAGDSVFNYDIMEWAAEYIEKNPNIINR